MQKLQRWYEIVGQTLYVYNDPYPHKATAVSVVNPSDMPYYRNNFQLEKVWK